MLAMQFIAIVIVSTLLSALFLFFLTIPQIRAKESAAAKIPSWIESQLAARETLLHQFGDQLKKKPDLEPPDRTWQNSMAENAGFFDTIYLLDKKGRITMAFPQRHHIPNDTNPPRSDLFQRGKNITRAYWSDVFLSPVTKEMSCAYIIPLHEGQLVGEIHLTHFSAILKEQHFPLTTVVLDQNNHIVASNGKVLAILQKEPKPFEPHPEKSAFDKPADEDMFSLQKTLNGTSWSLFTTLPDYSFTQNIRTYALFFFLSLASGTILALGFSIYTSRSLNLRIRARIKNMRDIARGSYSPVSAADPIREMAHLSQNLERMSMTIQEKETGYNKAMAHYLEIIKAIENFVVVLDENLLITHVNDASKSIFGLDPEKCTGRSFLEFVQPDKIEPTKERHARWIEQGLESVTVEDEFIDSGGKHHTVFWNITLNRDERGRFTGFTGIGHEFSTWKAMQEELQLAALVYQKSIEAMVVINEDNLIISVNPAFEKITGYAPGEVLYQNPSMLGSALHDKAVYDSIWNALETSGNWHGEVWNMRKNGEMYAIRLTINTIRAPDRKTYRRVALFSDITEQKLAEKIIWQQNYFDSLTGLPNRNFLKQELSRAKRANIPVALMFLDLDGFKNINETLGHLTGDLLLQETAQRLQSCVRETDTVIRLGSDEFAILLRELTTPEEVEQIGKTILSGLSESFFLNNTVIHISASIGITFYPDDATDIDDILKNADQAMHAAKREGRNTLLYFTQSMQERAQARMHLIQDLRQALAGQQFEIMYQPIVDIESGLIRKAEALIRWQHPLKGTINPVEFISIAEDTGMIASFGNWIFHEAASQARIWRNRFHPDFQISINLSPVQFKNEGIDFINWLSHLQELQLPGNGLVVEITEGLLLEGSEHVKQQLAAFKNAGMEIALDDFGVGYSSLSYLHTFNFDYLKIDQSFIKNLSLGGDNQALCEAIVVMAHKLNLKVIAEGIETIRQREILVEAACDFGQGYLYSTPLSPPEFEQILENNYALFNLNIQADIA
ncbi:EAL domain-containing protein [Oxalobacter sp. OttesenSCG-928-P03]|nr:EAL domain-containing protein [Oxalobacter sp. OttesenSCG-928-P03]